MFLPSRAGNRGTGWSCSMCCMGDFAESEDVCPQHRPCASVRLHLLQPRSLERQEKKKWLHWFSPVLSVHFMVTAPTLIQAPVSAAFLGSIPTPVCSAQPRSLQTSTHRSRSSRTHSFIPGECQQDGAFLNARLDVISDMH